MENDVDIVENEDIVNSNKKSNNQNFVLTKEQFELMKKIRDETLSRTERYSELISNDPNSNESLYKISGDNKKKKKIRNKNVNTVEDTNLNTLEVLDKSKKEEINPNKERIYRTSQPFLFIKGEPYIILGPNTEYYVWIFSIVSFFSIIIYSLKNSFIILKLLFICGYLFFAITYTLLLLLNPGIPTNKKNLDVSMLQKHYHQCKECNSISFKQEGKMTLHCQNCNICVEHFDHHCAFATKCIGRGNKKIFKFWIYSIISFFVIIFLYLIF